MPSVYGMPIYNSKTIWNYSTILLKLSKWIQKMEGSSLKDSGEGEKEENALKIDPKPSWNFKLNVNIIGRITRNDVLEMPCSPDDIPFVFFVRLGKALGELAKTLGFEIDYRNICFRMRGAAGHNFFLKIGKNWKKARKLGWTRLVFFFLPSLPPSLPPLLTGARNGEAVLIRYRVR